VDSGSDICIIKESFIKTTEHLNKNFTYNLFGIGDGSIPTLGCIENTLHFSKFSITHDFHVVDSSFPIPCDGIIGLDFIKNHSCNLDYHENDTDWFIIRPHFTPQNEYLEIFHSPKPNSISLPARAEVVRKINVKSQEDDILIPNQEIAQGVYIANTIVSKNSPFVKILNTNNKNILIENPSIATESLNDYHVISIDKIADNDERKKQILSKISQNCPLQYKKKLLELCSNFTDVFATESDKVTCNNFYTQKLRLKDETPVYIKNYRVPHSQKPEIEKHITKMLEDDIIEPSASEYNSPILLVPKKSLPNSSEKRWRLVVDYRQVNKKLMSDKYPLPRIDDILDQLGRAKTFSCLDLVSGFHQIQLDEKSRDITSFSSSQGSFRFKRLPYGLKIAPNSFQRMMALAFAGLGPGRAFLYMDDLIVLGCSESHMLSNLKEVFKICRKTNLKLHPEKCIFFSPEVTFLGHKCTNEGILPDDSKFEKILNYPRPTNSDEVRRFVAFMNYYRRFIPKFSYYSIHLTRLTRKKVPFIWTEDCEKAFLYLKNSLLSPKILKYPDFDKEFCITTDASKIACGAILSQNYNGTQLPVAFASRSFTKGESNKSVIEQELTAIHWALNFFKPYIYGKKFLVKSDHKPLTYLFTLKNPSSKLTRMRLDLEEFDFTVEYIKGKNNCGADALSRIDFGQIKQIKDENAQVFQVLTRSKSMQNPISQNVPNKKLINQSSRAPNVYETVTFIGVKKLPCLKFNEKSREIIILKGKKQLVKVDLSDLIVNKKIALEQLFLRLEKSVDNIGFKNLQISKNNELFNYTTLNEFKNEGNKHLKIVTIALTPTIETVTSPTKKFEILKQFHKDPITGGHCGISRCLSKIKRQYVWKNLSKDVKNFVKNCDVCKKNKSGLKSKEPLIKTPTPEKAFDRIQVDTIGPLPKTAFENEYAVTIMCELTKFLITVAIPNKSAKNVAKAIVENCILIFGPVKEIISDMGSEYKNQVLLEICHLLKIEHRTSTAYHHQTMGMIERNHRTLNEYLRSYVASDKSDWDQWLKFYTYCYNTTPSSVHGYAPFELVFGKSPTVFEFLKNNKVDPVYNIEAYDKELKFRLQEAQKRAFEFIEKAKHLSKKYYDRDSNAQNIKINDKIFLKDEASHKLDSVYKGPYKVLDVDNLGNCKIKIGTKEKIVHKNRIKPA